MTSSIALSLLSLKEAIVNVMRRVSGILDKMKVRYGEPIQYELFSGASAVAMNSLVGKEISISFSSEIFCSACGKGIFKTYGQGFCYPCFKEAPENSECIIRPELCRAHLGGGRDPEWESRNHLQPHIVYLAVSDQVKVGVTRGDQIPVRWIDQGAILATELIRTENRYEAGVAEVFLKEHFKDKTNWRNMLKGITVPDFPLEETYNLALGLLDKCSATYVSASFAPWRFEYPVNEYPVKLRSLDLQKAPLISGVLLGIKGQYLILDDDRVMNIRKHTGFRVELTY